MQLDPEELARHARRALIQDECGLSYFLFADHFSELDLLRSTIEDLIAREESAEIGRLSPHADALPEQRRSEFWAENHPYWWEHIIAPQFRASFFIAMMAAVEVHLNRFVRDAGTVAMAPIDVDELKGPLYPRARRFLQRFCAIEAPGEASWQLLSSYYLVRNALAHASGFIGEGKRARKIEALARRTDGLTIAAGHVELHAGFCTAAHSNCRRFLLDIWGELVLLCRRHREASQE